MPFQIIRNDITKVKADAIVNTANPRPLIGGGTDSAIYKAAGERPLLSERKKIGNIARGDIAVTPAFKLKAKYIIHTVGPVWQGGESNEFNILRSCYSKSLAKALELKCESIAFPLISTGTYGFPKDAALQIALDEISGFLMKNDTDMIVSLVVFDNNAFRLSKNLFLEVESFIDDQDIIDTYRREYEIDEYDYYPLDNNYNREYRRELELERSLESARTMSISSIDTSLRPKKPFTAETFDPSQFMNDDKGSHTFKDCLLDFIIQKDIDNAKVWKTSNLTKGQFSKIMCGDTKIPKKDTVLCLCIGLHLTVEESEILLASANMAFNPFEKRDMLIKQCIDNEQFDFFSINAMLCMCELPSIGVPE